MLARKIPGEAAPGESRRDRLDAPSLPSIPPTGGERGEEGAETKNNNEITVTKANTGAHSLAAPGPTANKQSPLFAR